VCLCWLHRLPVSQPVFSRQPRWSGSVCTALLQPISVTSATATFDPEIYWFTLLNCSREETNQPPGTVCRVYYSHQSCHRMLSYVHWRCTFSRAPGTVETFFVILVPNINTMTDWLTYLVTQPRGDLSHTSSGMLPMPLLPVRLEVTIPPVVHHQLASTKLYSWRQKHVCEQLAQGCHKTRNIWASNAQPLSNILTSAPPCLTMPCL